MSLRHFLLVLGAAFCTNAATAQITQTNLPIIIITTGNAIADTQVLGNMKIIDNGSNLNHPADPVKFQGNIGVKYRGSSTFPKRSYNVETWTNIQKVSLDTSLLGMPSENDWVLLACYTDRSLMRNLVGFRLWEQIGYYSARMRPVEVIVNNSYAGIYLFGEKIKRDPGRLDLATLKTTDASAPEITGGYIMRIDNSNDAYWTSAITPPYATTGQTIRFHYEEPADNDITPIQMNYIKSYVDSFEAALQGSNFQDTTNGWRKYAAHNSFEDYLLINEVLKSEDAYRLSTYLYKDKNKKLRMGPLWDLELSLYNTTDCNASKDTGWAYMHGATCGSDAYLPPFWWERLTGDADYMTQVKCKYTHWRSTVLDTTQIFTFMDSISMLLNAQQAVTRNFTAYPIFGTSLVNEPTPLSTNYTDEVNHIKGFIRRRLQYLDSKWFTPACILNVPYMELPGATASFAPNPAFETLNVTINCSKTADLTIIVRDMLGRIMTQETHKKIGSGEHQYHYDVADWPSGIYTFTLATDNTQAKTYKIVKQ